MSIALFIVYLLTFCYWLFRWGKKHLSNKWFRRILLLAFLLRVGAGVFFTHYVRDLPGNDNWIVFNASIEETSWLLHDTPDFFYKDIFDNNGYKGNPFKSFFFRNGHNFYFNDLKDNLVIKYQAILNVFSGCNHYINVLISNFLVMWSLITLIGVFRRGLQPRWYWTVWAVFLLYPPLILWTSIIQKDMLCLLLFAVILYTYAALKESSSRKHILYWTLLGLSLFFLLLLKNYMAMILVSSLLLVKIAKLSNRYFVRCFWMLLIGIFVFFAISSFFPDSINFPLLLARKQNGFYDINGGQHIASIPLTGHIGSYISNLPNALMNGFLFPLSGYLFGERLGWIGFGSILLFVVLTFCVFLFPRKSGSWQNPFFLLMFAFSLLSYLLIGQSVAYYGALLRYRSIPETIFVVLLLQLIDFQKIRQLYINN